MCRRMTIEMGEHRVNLEKMEIRLLERGVFHLPEGLAILLLERAVIRALQPS